MKKSTINLSLAGSTDYKKVLKFFEAFRRFVIIYSVVLCVFLIIIFFVNSSITSQSAKTTEEKQRHLNQLSAFTNQEAELSYIDQKIALIEEYAAQDARSLPYYRVLTETTGTTTTSATLTSFAINKDRKTKFIVSLPSLDQSLAYLRTTQNNTLLQNFLTLSLKNAQFYSKPPHYELLFEGTFKPLE